MNLHTPPACAHQNANIISQNIHPMIYNPVSLCPSVFKILLMDTHVSLFYTAVISLALQQGDIFNTSGWISGCWSVGDPPVAVPSRCHRSCVSCVISDVFSCLLPLKPRSRQQGHAATGCNSQRLCLQSPHVWFCFFLFPPADLFNVSWALRLTADIMQMEIWDPKKGGGSRGRADGVPKSAQLVLGDWLLT